MKSSELEQLIPDALAETKLRRTHPSDLEGALAGRLEFVGPHLAIARTLDVINNSNVGMPFKEKLDFYLTHGHPELLVDYPDSSYGVYAAGPYLVIAEQEEVFDTPVIIVENVPTYSNRAPGVRFTRKDISKSQEMKSLLRSCHYPDDVSNALLFFIANDEKELTTPTNGPGPENLFQKYTPYFRATTRR